MPKQTAEKIWDEVMDFAGYAFNKSHAAAYAVVAYYTAWLKYYYPTEFMAAMLNSYIGNLSQAATYIETCKHMGIAVLPPDINASFVKFSTENGGVRMGLGAVKNVGLQALGEMIEERQENGPYASFGDFLTRVAPLSLNRKMIESLVRASAFDQFGIDRNAMVAVVEPYLSQCHKRSSEVMVGQVSLFDIGNSEPPPVPEPDYPTLPPVSRNDRLAMEREMTGVYITGHPLDAYRETLTRHVSCSSASFQMQDAATDDAAEQTVAADTSVVEGQMVLMGGIIMQRTDKLTRRGDMMSFVTVEDFSGRFEVIVFPDLFQSRSADLAEQTVLVVYGRVSTSDDTETKLIAEDIFLLPDDETAKTPEGQALLDPLPDPRTIVQNRSHSRKTSLRKGSNHSSNNGDDRSLSASDQRSHEGTAVPAVDSKERPSLGRSGLVIALPSDLSEIHRNRLLSTLCYFQGSTPTYLYSREEKACVALPAKYWLQLDSYVLNLLIYRYGQQNITFLDRDILDQFALRA
ncbi:MAG TPA: hypothetical protein GX717_04140 [Clostridiaceae bacterium]|nr:hypothetical protein [Clostridiaceae bacterium]